MDLSSLEFSYKEEGYSIFTDVYDGDNKFHILAEKDLKQIVFAANIAITDKLIELAYAGAIKVGTAYCVCISLPKSDIIETCVELGLGIIQISSKGDLFHIILEPINEWVDTEISNFDTTDQSTLRKVKHSDIIFKRIKVYLSNNNTAKWKEIYDNVVSHYTTLSILKNVMKKQYDFDLEKYRKASFKV